MKKKIKKLKPKNAPGFRDLEGNLLFMKESDSVSKIINYYITG